MGICTCIKSSPSSTQSNIILSQCASQRDFGPKKLDTTLIATNIKFSTPPIAPFEIALLNEINSVRTNPKEYANRLRELIDDIQYEDNNCYLIYKKNEKILLQKGVETFEETIKYLDAIEPMSEFKRKDELKIKIKDITCKESSIGNILVEKRQYLLKSYNTCIFNLDFFSNPVLSVIFQITDEAFQNQRRDALLNKSAKFFAVSYTYNFIKKVLSVSTICS